MRRGPTPTTSPSPTPSSPPTRRAQTWHHPPGSSLAAWTHRVERSTVVYLQPGDGPGAFANDQYRRLLTNAITWAASTRP